MTMSKQMAKLTQIKVMRLKLAQQRLSHAAFASRKSRDALELGQQKSRATHQAAKNHMREQITLKAQDSRTPNRTFCAGLFVEGLRKYAVAEDARVYVGNLIEDYDANLEEQERASQKVIKIKRANDRFADQVRQTLNKNDEAVENENDEDVMELTALKVRRCEDA